MARARRKESLQRPRGTRDIVAEEWRGLDAMLDVVRGVASFYNFSRIETPTFEHTELFERGVGESSDIVKKEMYSFSTAGGTRLTLRPEGTAPVVRAYIENGMKALPQPVKLWYWGPMFRHERPQHGRLREFFQFGLEIIGESDPVLDVEVIHAVTVVLRSLQLKNLIVLVNSIGCSSCRPSYLQGLREFYRSHKKQLCKLCRDRLDRNPLLLLDCKEEKCQRITHKAAQMIDHLCAGCHGAFTEVLDYLEYLQIPYRLEPSLVRGLEYYTRTVFEIVVEEEGESADGARSDGSPAPALNGAKEEENNEQPTRIALAGGGRYDGLVAELGGDSTPAVGAAAGVERVLSEMVRQGVMPSATPAPRVFVAQLGLEARRRVFGLLEDLRAKNIAAAFSLSKGNVKSQLKIADRIGADAVVMLGRKEVLEQSAILRDMENSTQISIPINRLMTELGKILRRKPRAEKRRSAPEPEEEKEEDAGAAG